MDEEGNEVCGCDYRLYWNQGPFVNEVTSAKVGDICLVQEDIRMKPKVVAFLKEATRQLLGEAHQGHLLNSSHFFFVWLSCKIIYVYVMLTISENLCENRRRNRVAKDT